MDEQDPRLAAERIARRGIDEPIGLDSSAAERRSTTRSAKRPACAATASGTTTNIASSGPGSDDDRRTREIRADIEQTRDELSETVTAIQDRLRPSSVAATAAQTVKTAASDAARQMVDSEPVQYVRAKPIPSAMVGIGVAGLAWLAFGRRGAPTASRQYADRRAAEARLAPRKEGGYDNPPGGHSGYAASSHPQASYGGTSQRADFYAHTSEGARQAATRVQNQLTRIWNESPLLLGAAAMVAGGIVGLAVPETERENQVMGEARDTVVENVQRSVGERVSQVQEGAADALSRVQDIAKNAMGLTDIQS